MTDSTPVPSSSPSATAPTWVLLEGTARIALSLDARSPELTSVDPQVVAELRALTGGGDGTINVDDSAAESVDAAVDALIEHLSRHVRYEVTVERDDVPVDAGTPQAGSAAQRPVLRITAARRGRGVGDLLADIAGYLIADANFAAGAGATPSTVSPWLSVTSVVTPTDATTPSAVRFHSVTHLAHDDPSAEPHGQVVLTLGQHQVVQITAAALAASHSRDSRQTASVRAGEPGSDPVDSEASGAGAAEATPLDDVDVLLAGILRSVVAQIEQNQLDEDEAGDQSVLDDRQAVIETLVMAATMLEEHVTHRNPEITTLVTSNLRQLAQRSEAAVPEHIRANPAAALEHLADGTGSEDAESGVNPVQLSLAVAAELAADRIAQF